jgi:hypothetical protein
MKTVRLFLIAVTLVATAASLSEGTAAAGRARAAGSVVFYSDVANVIPGPS